MTSAVLPAAAADVDLGNRISNYLRSINHSSFESLSVEVRHGEVLLSGKLPTAADKSLAINACQRVAGVMKLCEAIEIGK